MYYASFNHLPQLICFRSLDLKTHLPFIHDWVNMSYTKAFWQMDGSFQQLLEIYQKIIDHPNAHSFIGYYGDRPICQLDIYMIGVDELSFIIPQHESDCGFHLLMAPNQKRIPGLTVAVIRAFLEYYFSFTRALKMFAEPDCRNERSIALLKQTGFHFLQTIRLSYKTAHLYCLDKTSFFNQ